jgi:hypothetical protein
MPSFATIIWKLHTWGMVKRIGDAQGVATTAQTFA